MKSALYLRLEKYIIIILALVFLGASISLSVLFYQTNAEKIPAIGGTYKEGLVGSFSSINPLFADFNEAEQDVTQLVFSGLTKYDPETKHIVEDIATYSISEDQKTYTFTLKDNVLWHDKTPVTADDIVFTFQDTIQNPNFANEFLRQSFDGIQITKVDEKTVSFTLTKPYAFFPAQLTVGLLPKHIWGSIPVEQYRDHVLNKSPIGNGPYRITDSIQSLPKATDTISRINLERFPEYFEKDKYMMQYIIFEAYSTEEGLMKHAKEYNGLKRISYDYKAEMEKNGNLALYSYALPQYVSLFLNTNSPLLKDSKLRLGLRLGTDKDELLAKYPDTKRIDTPFLELDEQSWFSQYDLERANGALFDSGWKVKEGETLITDINQVPPTPVLPDPSQIEEAEEQTPTEEATPEDNTEETPSKDTSTEASEATEETTEASSTETSTPQFYITAPTSKDTFKTSKTAIQIKGTLPANTQEVIVNDYSLQQFEAGETSFSYNTSLSIGNLKEGENKFDVYIVDSQEQKTLFDTITIVQDPTLTIDVMEGNDPRATETASTNTPTSTESTENTTKEEEEEEEAPADPATTPSIPVRYKNGTPLILTLVTRDSPPIYQSIAEDLRKEYALLGVDLRIKVVSSGDMQTVLDEKNYDILLFGQKLGYNLDAYPFWHSSQAGKGGVNFSNYQSFRSNQLLEELRTPEAGLSIDEQQEARQEDLKKLEQIFSEDTPAIFLYQPLYYYGIDPNIKGFHLNSLAYHKDRFGSLRDWYIQEKLFWNKPFGLGDIWNWLYKNLS